MDKDKMFQFIRACMMDYAEGQDIHWDIDPGNPDVRISGDSDFDIGFRPVIIRSALTYIRDHRHEMRDRYEDMKPRVRNQSQFEFCLLVEVAGSKFGNGYTHAGFIKFLAWVCYLAFRFFEDGQKDYPEIAMQVVYDVLEYFTIGTDSFVRQGSIPGMVREAGRLEYESVFNAVHIPRHQILNNTFWY